VGGIKYKMHVGWVEASNPTPAHVTLPLTHPTNNCASLLTVAFVVKNQENLIPRFPSQAPRASSITIRIVTLCEDLANRDDPIRQNKYNHLN
jgi:hypothetical protein